MSLTYVQYVADGNTAEFEVPFPFANRTHVKVAINGATPIYPVRWVGDSRIALADNFAAGSLIEVWRETPLSERLVDFQNGSVLTEEELDLAINQVFYIQQELKERYDRGLGSAVTRVATNGGVVSVDPDDVIAELANLVISEEVVADLRQAISDIGLNTESIANQALSLGGLRDDHETLVGIVDALASADPGTGIATLIQDETNARISGDTALANTLSLIGAKSGDNLSFILDLSKVKVSPTESLATRLNTLGAADSNALALIQSEQTARINADSALTTSINSLGTRMGNAEAAIVAEQNTRAAADTAEATARTALAARVTTAEGNITANSAAITNEATARANADSAFASQLSLLGAQNAGGTAWILDLNKVRVDGTTSLGTRLTGIDTQIANNAASIVSEQTARASADSALSSQITTLTTTVNGNTASVNTLQASVNGLQAKYGVSLNVNGYITGFVQNNNGTQGTFTILADKFSIVSPGGGTPVTPFSVTSAGVQINGSLIVNGSIINDQFNMATLVKRASTSFSGSTTPSAGQTTVVAEVTLGDIGKDGSIQLDYQVQATAYIGQSSGYIGGYPLTTTYMADGGVFVQVIDGNANVLAEQALTGSQYGSSYAQTYEVGGFGTTVVELTGAAKTGLRLRVIVRRNNVDTGNVFGGDYYTRNISATYTITSASAKAKWTFI